MKPFKPMLAATLTDSCDDNVIYKCMKKLRYPVIATEKVDGIRAVKRNGILVSRTLKPIPSSSLQLKARFLPEGLDMELFSWDISFQEIVSYVISVKGDTDPIKFVPLDIWNRNKIYSIRLQEMYKLLVYPYNFSGNITCLNTTSCDNADELWTMYLNMRDSGKEGICIRLPNSPYKFGRSTLKEQYLVKLACSYIGDAIIIGFKEKMINLSPAKINALGHTERSSYKDMTHPANTLGALIVRDIKSGIIFNIGTGFDDITRKEIWLNKDKYLGKTASYQAKSVGVKEKPRCSSYRGIRHDL